MKNRYKTALGLQYDELEDEVPKISLRGDNLTADEIVKTAKRYGVPVIEDPELAKALKAIPEREEIPEFLYEAVAIILKKIECGCSRLSRYIRPRK